LVKFLTENESNKSSNKIGKVAVIIPLIYGMYGIEYLLKDWNFGDYTYRIFYGYNWIKHMKIKKLIEPKRLSHMGCDLMSKNINEQYPGLFDVKIEEVIKDGTNFRYDLAVALSRKLLDECNIQDEFKFVLIVEVQEDNNNHDFNPNDEIKNQVVNSKGAIIKNFLEKKIKENNYIVIFIAEILHILYEILITFSEKYREGNLLLETQNVGKREIKKLTDELKYVDSDQQDMIKEEIDEWNILLDDLDNSTKQVRFLYNKKIEVNGIINKTTFYDRNIPLDYVLDNLNLKLKKSKVYYDHLNKLLLKYCRTIKNEQYFSYNSVIKFIQDLGIEGNNQLRIHFTNILLSVTDISNYYITIMQKYYRLIISKMRGDHMKKITDLITGKIERSNNLLNKNDEININIMEHRIKNFMSIAKKDNVIIDNLTISYVTDMSFINEININVYFSENIEDCMTSVKILSLMLNKGLKREKSKKLLNDFYKSLNDCGKLEFSKDEFIPYLYYKL
jgi:hypothetical protein